MTGRIRSLLVILAALGLVLPCAGPVLAGQADDTVDPVTTEVVRLLGEGLSSSLVLEWLETSGRRPETVGADDLIALSNAGASESLVQAYIALAGDLDSEPRAVKLPPPPTGPATLEVGLEYRPRKITGSPEDWHLFVYLDGSLLVWSPGGDMVVDRKLELEPGHHLVRVLQERHTLVSVRKKEWKHEARVCLVPIELDLKAGTAHALDLEVVAEDAADGGVLSWTLTRGDEEAESSTNRGGSFYEWPALCEDILGNLPERKWDNRSTRKMMVGCSRWDSLWPAVADLPDRHQLRKEMQAQEFRPVL
jgi:hypothetical protein